MMQAPNIWRLRSNFMTNWVDLIVASERSDVLIQGRREQQRLPIRRSEIQYAANVWQETHISHPVCFIDDNSPS